MDGREPRIRPSGNSRRPIAYRVRLLSHRAGIRFSSRPSLQTHLPNADMTMDRRDEALRRINPQGRADVDS